MAEVGIHPVRFVHPDNAAANRWDEDDRTVSIAESLVCSILVAIGGMELREIAEHRVDHVTARYAVIDRAAAWEQPAVAPDQAQLQEASFEAFLDGAERWRFRAQLTRTASDFDTAMRLAEAAVKHAGTSSDRLIRATLARATIASTRADSAPHLAVGEHARHLAYQASLIALEGYDDSADSSCDRNMLPASLIVALRADIRTAAEVRSSSWLSCADDTLAKYEAARSLLDLPEGPERRCQHQLLKGRMHELRYDDAGSLDEIDAAISATRTAFESAFELANPDDLGTAGDQLTRQLLLRRTDGRTAAERYTAIESETRQVLLVALANSIPTSPSSLALIARCAEGFFHTGRSSDEPETSKFGLQLWAECCAFLQDRDPAACLTTARTWAEDLERAGDTRAAATPYRIAVSSRRRLYASHGHTAHGSIWTAQHDDLSSLAVAACAIDDPTGALEIAEDARSVTRRLPLSSPESELTELRERGFGDLVEEYLVASRDEVEAAAAARPINGPRPDLPLGQLEALIARLAVTGPRLREVQARIQAIPEFADFPRRAVFRDVRAAASDAPIIYLAAGFSSGSALIIRDPADDAPVHLRLPALTFQAVHERGLQLRAAYRTWVPPKDGLEGFPDLLERAGEWLWDAAMGPVVAHVGEAPLMRLVPMGLSALLPFHVAWTPNGTGRRYLLDSTAISYLPSAALLAHARRRPVADDWSALLIDGPGLLPQAAHDEVAMAKRRFAGRWKHLRGEEITTTAVMREVAHHSLVHISAHGALDENLPLDSGISVGPGEILRVKHLRWLEPPELDLLVLSSCESAMTGSLELDESVGFPGMLYGVFARTVIAAQWQVDQPSTAAVFRGFYREWDLSHEPSAIADGLRRAQLAVRDSGLSHPVWWAGFTMTG